MDTSQNSQEKDHFSKKEEKEKSRKRENNKKRLISIARWLVYLVIASAVLFGLYKLVTLPSAPALGETFPSLGQIHVNPGDLHPDYNSNPPTSGWHYLLPAQSGIYDKEFPDEELIHNLEHGQIWISYRPDLPKDQIDALAKIAMSYGSKMIMTPRAKDDSPIAIAAWTHLLKLTSVDEKQIRAFIDAYRGYGPELVPDSGFGDFRSKQ